MGMSFLVIMLQYLKHIVWPYTHQHSKKGILHKGGETNIPC